MVKEHVGGPSNFQEDRRQEEAITLEYYKAYAEMVERQTKAKGTALELPSSEPPADRNDGGAWVSFKVQGETVTAHITRVY